jgi:tetratricopeptide (TPR) repeat protein
VTDIAKLKRRAADLEAGKDIERAIVAYREIVEMFENGEADPIDIPLYNRLGDLLLKVGETAEAVAMWERAADHYADGGFNNPAIALCNKILRHSPGRTVVYLKLGRILVAKGFRVEARQHFVEYAHRTQQHGDLPEAFRALKEFADLVPDESDIRVMLADQLEKADLVDEAIGQLQLAHAQLTRQGKFPEADVVAARLRALDPEAELQVVQQDPMASADGLVFLDVGAANLPRPTGVFDGGMILASEAVEEDALVLPPPERGFFGEPAAREPAVGSEALTPVDVSWSGHGLLDGFEGSGVPDDLPAAPGLADIAPIDEAPASPIADLPLIEPDGMEPIALIDAPGLGATEGGRDLPRPTRRITSVALAPIVDVLAPQVGAAPGDWLLRRQYGEALLDAGRREEGIAELEEALDLCQRQGEAASVASLAEELVRVAPDAVRFHQRRVESAAASGDPQRLTGAFLDLGDALSRSGAPQRATAVFQRVLAIDPDDLRAHAALAALTPTPDSAPARSVSRVAPSPRRESGPAPAREGVEEEGLVSIGDWLKESIERGSTRIVVAEPAASEPRPMDSQGRPTRVTQGIAAQVAKEDHAAHYELGVAYREMGLIDEAIGAFQKALRSPGHRLRALEALGRCFVDKEQHAVGQAILERALAEPGATDQQLVGVLFLLGQMAEALGAAEEARRYYQRVFAVDDRFRDVVDRLNSLERITP